MSQLQDLAAGARNLLVNCVQLGAGESLMIVREDPDLGWYDGQTAQAIADEARRRRRLGGDLYLVARSQPFIDRLRRLGLLAVIGEDHILPDKHFAVAQIVPTLDPEICRTCEARIFHECARAPGGAAD